MYRLSTKQYKRDVIDVFANVSCEELYLMKGEVIARSMVSLKDNVKAKRGNDQEFIQSNPTLHPQN